jgi:AcrR family transcriptional regulator
MTRAHDATAAAITQAAAHLVAHHQDPTVGAVAQAIGVARGTVYRYFPTRQALLTTVFDQALGKAERHLTQANLAAVPVAEGLARAVRVWSPSGRTSWSWLTSGCSPEGTSRPSPPWRRCWIADARGRPS